MLAHNLNCLYSLKLENRNLPLVLSEWKSAKVVRIKYIMKHLLKMYKKYKYASLPNI